MEIIREFSLLDADMCVDLKKDLEKLLSKYFDKNKNKWTSQTLCIRDFLYATHDYIPSILNHMDSIIHGKRNHVVMDKEEVETSVEWKSSMLFFRATDLLKRYILYKRNCIKTCEKTTHFNFSVIKRNNFVRRSTLNKMSSFGKLHLYIKPRRGDLDILNRKYGTFMTPLSCGLIWSSLVFIIKKVAASKGLRRITFTTENDSFLANSGWMKDLMMQLSRVRKDWLIALKYHCIWWGPDSLWFAFVKDTP